MSKKTIFGQAAARVPSTWAAVTERMMSRWSPAEDEAGTSRRTTRGSTSAPPTAAKAGGKDAGGKPRARDGQRGRKEPEKESATKENTAVDSPDTPVVKKQQDLEQALRDAVSAVGNYGEIYDRNLQSLIPRSGGNLLNEAPYGPQQVALPLV